MMNYDSYLEMKTREYYKRQEQIYEKPLENVDLYFTLEDAIFSIDDKETLADCVNCILDEFGLSKFKKELDEEKLEQLIKDFEGVKHD